MDSNLSVADIAAVTRNNCGYGYGYGDCFGFGNGGGLFSILLLFALFGGGGFGWGNRNNWGFDGRVATVEDLNNSANFTRLENQVRFNENTIQNGFTNIGNGICQLGYQLAMDKGELSKEFAVGKGELAQQISVGNGALSQQIANCCCESQLAAQQIKFDMANYAAATNANTTAQVQKVLDKISESEKASMAARIQQLELQQAMCGVVRYPLATTYSVGYPTSCGGCGCNYGFANI